MKADDYFYEYPKEKKFKIGYFKNFEGNVLKIDNLNQISKVSNNLNVQEFRFHRLDDKVFSSKDFRKWYAVAPTLDIEKKDIPNSGILISPNPVKDILVIYNMDGLNFEIYSILGVKMFDGNVQTQLDVSFLESGIYFIKINYQIQKFIKI